MAPQSERTKIDQIVAEFFAKSLHIILESRIPYSSIQTDDSVPPSSLSSAYPVAVRPKDRWFNLVLGDCPSAQSSLEPWKRSQSEPMVVDILLLPSTKGVLDRPASIGTSSPKVSNTPWVGEARHLCAAGEGSLCGTVLERWVVKYERRNKSSNTEMLGMRRSRSGETLSGKDSSGVDTQSQGSPVLKVNARATVWTKEDGTPQLPPFPCHAIEVPSLYKRVVIMLRSLYCNVRTLPAHCLFRIANSSSANRGFRLSYRVSASPPPLGDVDEASMTTCSFTPVETPTGRMCLSVAYHHTTAITALEIMPRVQPRIIVDYVGNQNTDPIRRISSASYLGAVPGGGISGKVGVHVVSLPSSLPNSPSAASFGRRHSWNGGINKIQPVLLPPSLSSIRNSRSPSPSCPRDFLSNSPHASSPLRYSPSSRSSPSHSSYTRTGSHPSSFHPTEASSSPIPIQGQHTSPPFSPSISPSSPSSYLSHESGVTAGYPCNSSAPVSIPRSSVTRTQRFMVTDVSSPHQGRSALPPPSPQSKGMEPPLRALSSNSPPLLGQVSHQLVSAIDAKVSGRLSISTLGESSLFLSPTHPYRLCKMVDDAKGEGPASGLKISIYGSPRKSFTRCLSKSSLRDESDNEDFACPFAVDDDDLEYGNRGENPDTTEKGMDCYDGIKSQDAAVGALVRVLRSAAPLRDLSILVDAGGAEGKSCSLEGRKCSATIAYIDTSNSALFQSREFGLEVPLRSSPHVTSHVSMDLSSHKFFKTTADALEELKNHKEMRDFLLSQCGKKVPASES